MHKVDLKLFSFALSKKFLCVISLKTYYQKHEGNAENIVKIGKSKIHFFGRPYFDVVHSGILLFTLVLKICRHNDC